MNRILTGALALTLFLAPGGLAFAGGDDSERDETSESASAGDAFASPDPEPEYVPMTFVPIGEMVYRPLDGAGFALLSSPTGAAAPRDRREERPSLVPVLALGGLYDSLRRSGGVAPTSQVPTSQVPATQASAAARGPVSAPEPGALALLAFGLPALLRRRHTSG